LEADNPATFPHPIVILGGQFTSELILGNRLELEARCQSTYSASIKRWIVSDPQHLGGNPRVRGTRIPVSLVLESVAAGLSVSEIVDAYPSLTKEAVLGVLHEAAEVAA
jgi:uncharacterized protein (DUF433 family)